MNYSDMSLLELMCLIEKEEDQAIINRLALEITFRLYVPFSSVTFEELLVENGYRIIEKDKSRTL